MSNKSKPSPFKYGVSPNPRTWHDTATIINDMKPKKRHNSLMDRLNSIEQQLKDKK